MPTNPSDPFADANLEVARRWLSGNGREPAAPKKRRPPSQRAEVRLPDTYYFRSDPELREIIRELGQRYGDKSAVVILLLRHALEAYENGDLVIDLRSAGK